MISSLKIAVVAVNGDQWDGYPAEYDRVLNYIKNNDINNVIFLTGDIHTSWASDIAADYSTYDSSTGAGSDAVEMVCTSVTSTSFLTFTVPISAIKFFNPNIKYAELSKRGYLLLDIDSDRVQGDWMYMNTVATPTFTSTVGASWKTDYNDNHLSSTTPLSPRSSMPLQAAICPLTSSIPNTDIFVGLHCYPNPASQNISLQYYLYQNKQLKLKIRDSKGVTVFEKKLIHTDQSMKFLSLDISELTKGIYFLNLGDDKQSITHKIIIN